jgi:predicted transcriptional regulator
MTVGVVTLPIDKSVFDAANLLKKTRIGCVIVTKKGKAAGIITERDITYKVVATGKDPKKTKLGAAMSKPLRVIRASEKISDAALALKENKVKRLPVVDAKGRLIGIITEGDLIRVYPGVIDVISETAEIGPASASMLTGICDECGMHSDDLLKERGKLVCEECREEDAV